MVVSDAAVPAEPIPVTVVTGFLGAGKSTLLERWLRELPRETTVVLINEQGEVGIDGELLAERAARLREITGGCICCVARAAIDAALVEFAGSSPRPTRVLVETSGAASPAGVIRSLTQGDAREQLRLDGVITVFDVTRARRTLRFDLAVEQLAFADVVLLSHVDAIEPEPLAELEGELGSYAPGALIARASRGQLEGDASLLDLLAARSGVLRVGQQSDERRAGHGIDAVSLVHAGELDEARFGDWVEQTLGALQARILRVKGIQWLRWP